MKIIPHHIGLTVPNLDKAVAWYETVLEFQTETRLSVEATGLQIALLVSNDFRLELFQHPESSRKEAVYSNIAAHLPIEGWRHLAFQVDDLQQAMDDVLARGATLAAERVQNKALGFSYAFVADPFGNLVEFVQLDK